jgi:hypothetical protein
MKSFLPLGALAIGLLVAASSFRRPGGNPEVGTVPPEIDATGWFNHIGPPLSLQSLKGSAVVIEFWATW